MSEIINVSNKNLVKAKYAFNGSIFEKDGELYLAYRVNNSVIDARLAVNKLDRESFQPVGEPTQLCIPNPCKETDRGLFEDPRVFWYRDELYCAYVYVRDGYSAQAQGLAKLDSAFNVIETRFIRYMHNHNQALLDPVRKTGPGNVVYTYNPGNVFEKNWSFFQYANALMFIYKSSPHTVVHANLGSEGGVHRAYLANTDFPWKYGEIRGGTPPVLLGDRYLTFFHSSLAPEKGPMIYYAGAYTFEAKPPFKPLEITREPLLVGDLKDKKRGMWKKVVVFPCGALKIDKNWLVSYGHNDYCLKLLKLPEAELADRLTKI